MEVALSFDPNKGWHCSEKEDKALVHGYCLSYCHVSCTQMRRRVSYTFSINPVHLFRSIVYEVVTSTREHIIFFTWSHSARESQVYELLNPIGYLSAISGTALT